MPRPHARPPAASVLGCVCPEEAPVIGELRMRIALVILAGALSGCGSGGDIYYVPVGASSSPQIRTVSLQTDADFEPPEPGKGVGVFVDYSSGGQWRIQMVCDVLREVPCAYDPSQTCNPDPCVWDIVATALSGQLDVSDADIGSVDRVYRVSDGAVRVVFETAEEVDSVGLVADPGETLRVDAFLDFSYSEATKLFWITPDGAPEELDAPLGPVAFSPTAP